MRNVMPAACCVLLAGWTPADQRGETTRPGATAPAQQSTMDTIAEQYVKLVLALGQHDADYVDAYYGPPEWRKAAESSKVDLTAIGSKAADLVSALAREREPAGDMEKLRLHYLQRQLSALAARVRMLQGTRLSFDEESRA